MPELIWDGKCDENGNKRAPVRIALPFQTVETVNESVQQRQAALTLFESGREPEWRNRLIWGDKKYVLPSLLAEFAGQVNLIYIDPPFDTGADFSFTTRIPDTDRNFEKEPSIIEQKAYRDTWGGGLDTYEQWMYESLVLLAELLAEDGTLYVHVGSNVSHYVKLILDEVLGGQRYVNEIIWKRQTAHSDSGQGAKHLGRIHDVIFLYTKSDSHTWHMQYTEYDATHIERFYRHVEERTGRRYGLSDATAPGGAKADKGNPRYEFLGVTRYWRFSKERMEELYEEGRILQTKPGRVPRHKRYLDEMPGMPLQDIWVDVKPPQSWGRELLGYPTQKPEALLERIMKVSSNEGDLVLDCFCGSGTTAAVAEKLGRRWIAADLSRFAIHVTRKRLLGIEGVQPFVMQNLGKYERQQWQVAEFEEPDDARLRQQRYRGFILDLYHAEPVSGHTWLHGVKAGRMVHVGAVDAPVTLADVKAVAAEVWHAAGTGKDAPQKLAADILGWEFAFELNETARQVAAEAKVDVAFKRIPREVLDKQAVAQGDVHFFELAALSVDVKRNKRSVTVELTDFVIPPDDVPEDVASAVTHWSQWIDYWAVDWDYKGDAFHNQWQSYRTKESPELQTRIAHKYEQAGDYTILVKVIDILGNDTTHTTQVKVS